MAPTDRPARSHADPSARPPCLVDDATPPEDHSSLAELLRSIVRFLTGDTSREPERGREPHDQPATGHDPRPGPSDQRDATVVWAPGDPSPGLFRAHQAVVAAHDHAERTTRAQRPLRCTGGDWAAHEAQDAARDQAHER